MKEYRIVHFPDYTLGKETGDDAFHDIEMDINDLAEDGWRVIHVLEKSRIFEDRNPGDKYHSYLTVFFERDKK